MSIQVVGAGFGRTGTASLKLALEELGFGPCYHMFECIENGDAPSWLLAEQAVRADCGVSLAGHFDKLFNNNMSGKQYRSTVDFPASIYYKELLQAYPDAKVVLSVRDSFEAWYESASATIASNAHWRQVHAMSWINPKFRDIPKMFWAVIWGNPRVFDGKFSDRAAAKRAYEDWISEVKKHVPERQLLVWNVKEGWKPLCEFLGVAAPETPFPRGNDSEEFRSWVNAWNRGIVVAGIAAAHVLAVGVAFAARAVARSRWWQGGGAQQSRQAGRR